MAQVRLADGTVYSAWEEVVQCLAALDVALVALPLHEDHHLAELLARDVLDSGAKQAVVAALSSHCHTLKQSTGYQWHDLLVLHPGTPLLHGLLKEYGQLHTHRDDEALYVLSGECLFGILTPEGDQIEVNVQVGEYLRIPAGSEHWFSVTASLALKAMRYFKTADGWVAEHSYGRTR
jgi:1,2-dihydroxy-3-keto-5-methylthiopentene dioxygenase